MKSELGCYLGSMPHCALFYVNGIIMLCGSVYKMQKILNMCSTYGQNIALKR